MCDCTPFPPFPSDFITRSRKRDPFINHHHHLPHFNPPPPNRKGGAIRALSGGGRSADFKPRSTTGGGGERTSYESLNELASVAAAPSGIADGDDFLGLKRELEEEEEEEEEEKSGGGLKEDELVLTGSSGDAEEVDGPPERPRHRSGGRQVMRRSNLLAKQVVSIRSACSLGFVAQLWVDAVSWVVVSVEVRPSLLSGDMEKFLLEDVCQVGDVVLVEDESVMENELRMIGLDTLVGYNVVTSERQSVGKVRGYSFDINSGAVVSLELDSFGISIIPASLVTTYCLLVEDILEVISDTVIVQEGALSRLQRLSKGLWNARNVDLYGDEMGENPYFEKQTMQSVRSRSNKKSSSRRKFRRRTRETEDDWELPMDY